MDQFNGIGGSYTVDPNTGERTLVERTQDPSFPVPDAQPVEPAAPQSDDPKGD
jgi:hypothetical protein